MIDLRSDTVTRPTPEMRRAMAEAVVGDDVYGDDPTVLILQNRIAQLLGKEAALFTPTGTMANQLSLASQTRPGDEVLIDRAAHIVHNEAGAAAALSGLQFRTYDSASGGCRVEDLRALRRTPQYWSPNTALVALENTHNGRGGEVFRLERMREIRAWADSEGLRVHLDGARLWNANVASGVRLEEYAACAHTVSVCFSKGLGAPVGSAIASDRETIVRAHRLRKMWGGGMRQVGVLAAAALWGIEHNWPKLAEDHRKASQLAEVIQGCRGLRLERPPETNILMVEVTDPADKPEQVMADLEREGVLVAVWDPRRFRILTHLDASFEDVEQVAVALKKVRG